MHSGSIHHRMSKVFGHRVLIYCFAYQVFQPKARDGTQYDNPILRFGHTGGNVQTEQPWVNTDAQKENGKRGIYGGIHTNIIFPLTAFSVAPLFGWHSSRIFICAKCAHTCMKQLRYGIRTDLPYSFCASDFHSHALLSAYLTESSRYLLGLNQEEWKHQGSATPKLTY